MQASFPSYKAPQLAPEKARIINCLCALGRTWALPFGLAQSNWELLGSSHAFPAACAAVFRIGAQVWTARFSDETFLLCHPAFAADNDAFAPEELPAEIRAAVLRALLASVTDRLQAALCVPVAIESVKLASDAAVPSPIELNFRVTITDRPGKDDLSLFVALAPLHAAYASELADILAAMPKKTSPAFPKLDALPLELAFESGYLDLNMNDARALETGDVLIPAVWFGSEGKLLLRLCSGHTAPFSAFCSFADGKAVLEAPLSLDVEPSMAASELNDVEIRLSFELDRTVITLGELSSLTPGHVFQLGCDIQTPVTIRANGKAIARGRLVDMDGTLGVQISETL